MSFSNEPKSAADADYSDFHARIEKYVKDAEAHLKLPPDAIGNTWFESDFGFVLKVCGVVEPLMKEAVREHVRRAIEHPKVASSGSEALLKAIGDLGVDRLRIILLEFGAIDGKTSAVLQALFQVRNRYAHHIANAHLSVREICEKIAAEPNGDKQMLNKLIGLDGQPPDSVVVSFLRGVMFYNVAWFLQAAVHIVKPPPLPSGGILSPYFDEISKNRDSTPLS
jgi:hypothetical protein